MTFEELLDQALAMLQRRGRVTYGMLTRQFQLDEEALADLKEALLYTSPEVRDEAGRGLVWTGKAVALPSVPSPSTGPREREPLSYTPTHLAEKILTSKTALEGERKQVTVLFADLKGSMELLADRDPEDARAILDPVLERMMAAVHRYEGTVNQVMGDGIMALFGAPLAHEDHAVRACYAALAMQASVKQYAAEVQRTKGVPLQMRVGLNSGEVVVRAIDSSLHMDYTAVGQTTHLAARMEQLAMPGSILITADVLRLAEGYVQVTSLGPLAVKGLRAPVEAYELLGAGPVQTRLQAAAVRGLTRFVGRDREVHQLHQALQWAENGHGQVIALVGEPGVGKSRLVEECLHWPRAQRWVVLETRALSYGQATPYLPVIDLLKDYYGIDDHDDPQGMRAKVIGKMMKLDETLRSILPPILALLDVPVDEAAWSRLDPPQRRQRTLDALTRLVLRESQRQPVLLVVEDLHWMDSETQAFLDNLVDSLPTAPMLLLITYRPEYTHGWGQKTYYTQLRLDPLPPAGAEELLETLLGDDPGLMPLKQRLVERTEGNPFFLEESVRTLVETGALVGAPGTYRLAQAPPTMQVPATVQAVLAARIDRLPLEEKRLLQTAAVIGTEVPLPLLRAIAELPEAALQQGLAHLQAAEFLYVTRLFPEYEYTFKHALTHEVAYGSLLLERRQALHARILGALEALARDRLPEQVEPLAYHALRGKVWDKALVYARQAGEKAMARSAHHEAVRSFEQALRVLPQLPETRSTREQALDLRFALRSALRPLGEVDRLLAVLEEAEALAAALNDPRRQGQVALFMSQHYRMLGRHDEATAAAQRTLALATASGDGVLQALTNQYLGLAYHVRGDYRRAIDCLMQTIALLDGAHRHERFGQIIVPAVNSRAWIAVSHAELGQFPEGRVLGDEGLQLAEALAHPDSLLNASRGVGLLALRQGDTPRALHVLERAMDIGRTADVSNTVLNIGPALGAAYTLTGRVAAAVPLLTQVLERIRAHDMGENLVFCSLSLGEAYLQVGQLEEAYALVERALAFARAHQERGHEAYALRLFGEIDTHRTLQDGDAAATHYQQALKLADELGMRPLQAHCHCSLGTLYAKISRREQAHAELATALELYRAMTMTCWLPQAEAALARVEGRP